MATKPIYKPEIARDDVNLPNTGTPNKSRPSAGLRTTGYDKGQKPAVEEFNWQFDNLADWVDYLEEVTDNIPDQATPLLNRVLNGAAQDQDGSAVVAITSVYQQGPTYNFEMKAVDSSAGSIEYSITDLVGLSGTAARVSALTTGGSGQLFSRSIVLAENVQELDAGVAYFTANVHHTSVSVINFRINIYVNAIRNDSSSAVLAGSSTPIGVPQNTDTKLDYSIDLSPVANTENGFSVEIQADCPNVSAIEIYFTDIRALDKDIVDYPFFVYDPRQSDARTLNGQPQSFYRDASNLNSGSVPSDRLSGAYPIDITGNAATATVASSVDDADRLDGQHGAFYQDLNNSTGTLPDGNLGGNYTGLEITPSDKTSQQEKLGIYSGAVSLAGSWEKQPTDWVVSKGPIGRYVITPAGINPQTDLIVVANTKGAPVTSNSCMITSIGSTSFTVEVRNNGNYFSNEPFYFIATDYS